MAITQGNYFGAHNTYNFTYIKYIRLCSINKNVLRVKLGNTKLYPNYVFGPKLKFLLKIVIPFLYLQQRQVMIMIIINRNNEGKTVTPPTNTAKHTY